MQYAPVIAAKRDGTSLTADQIRGVVDGITSGDMADAQIGAFAMAVLLKGLDAEERVTLTTAMQHSGDTLTWDLPGPVVDKHSTGGVGDTVSLVLAPALAACGLYVPMISGRGLGHTGGTLDKLEAIPGYSTKPDAPTFRRITREVGCAIVGQTDDLAPADRRLYAIRDVTGTVESIDLICASILSKKLAAGLQALVLDVKTGSGAFMAREEDAKKLAETLVQVAGDAGCRTSALITDMSEPLASSAGNGLEVATAAALLTGHEIDSRLWDVTVALGGELLELTGTTGGAQRIADVLQSGAAAERFSAMTRALGGPSDFLDRFRHYLPEAPVITDVQSEGSGFVSAIDTRAIGQSVVELGGGRNAPTDTIRHDVGLDQLAGLGAMIDGQTPLARIHAGTIEDAERAASAIRAAYSLSDTPTDEPSLIRERIA